MVLGADVTPLYFEKELSWLSFNERVLQEAKDPTNPIIERIRFLGIFSNNLDEFFMVRVASLKAQVEAGIRKKSIDGLTPKEQLKKINKDICGG